MEALGIVDCFSVPRIGFVLPPSPLSLPAFLPSCLALVFPFIASSASLSLSPSLLVPLLCNPSLSARSPDG
eukprot:1526747-Rhodomonas_salina.1